MTTTLGVLLAPPASLCVLLLLSPFSGCWARPQDLMVLRRVFCPPRAADCPGAGPKVRVGAALGLSNAANEIAPDLRRGYEFFFSQHAERLGGVRLNGSQHAVELLLVDDDADAGSSWTARSGWAAGYLLEQEGVQLFLGPTDSYKTRVVGLRLQSAGGVLVAPATFASWLPTGLRNVFVTMPKRAHYFSLLEALTAATNGTVTTLYTVGLGKIFPSTWRNFVVVKQAIGPSQWTPRTMDGLLDEVRRAAPDVFMVWAVGTVCHSLLRRAWEAHYSPKAFIVFGCTPGEGLLDAVGNAGQYAVFLTPWLSSMRLSGSLTGNWTSESFAVEYRRRYGADPSHFAASAFTAAAVLVRGIERAGSLSPADVARAIRGARYDSIFGSFTFDSMGRSTLGMQPVQHQMTRLPLPLPVPSCPACGSALVYPKPRRALVECRDTGHAASSYGWLNGTCRRCPAGTESESAVLASGASARRLCRPCAAGRSAPRAGGGCSDCSMGFFSGGAGAEHCEACPLGRAVQAVGATGCERCAVGHVAHLPGRLRCKPCHAGTYQNETGGSACTRCAAGSYGALEGATACAACPPALSTPATGAAAASDCGCPAGTFDPSAWAAGGPRRCEPCPAGLRCPGFAAPLELRPGYHEEAGAFSPLRGVWKCATEAACPGGPPGTCRGELRGTACSGCPEGRARGAGGGCGRCHGGNGLLLPLAGLGLPAALVGYYYAGRSQTVLKETPVRLGVSITASVTVSTTQLLGTLYQLDVRWPEGVRPVLLGASALVDTEVLGLECMGGGRPEASYVLLCSAPFAVVAVFVLLALASRWLPCLTRRRVRAWPYASAFDVLGSLGQMSFIALAALAATSLQCYGHPNGKQSMTRFPGIICFEGGAHARVLAAGLLLLGLIVVPFVALSVWGCYSVYVCSLRDGVGAPQLEMYSFLIWRFRPLVWWWSTVFNTRQLLLGLCPVVAPGDPSLQLLVMQVVLLAYLVLATAFLPWRSLDLNLLDVLITLLMVCVVVAVSNLVPASAGAPAILAVVVALTLALVAAAIVRTLALLLLRGRAGHFGLRFPRPDRMDVFAEAWGRLASRVSSLELRDHVKLLHSMDDLDRRAIDGVMSIIQASYDMRRTQSLKVEQHFSPWRTRTRVLRVDSSFALERAQSGERASWSAPLAADGDGDAAWEVCAAAAGAGRSGPAPEDAAVELAPAADCEARALAAVAEDSLSRASTGRGQRGVARGGGGAPAVVLGRAADASAHLALEPPPGAPASSLLAL